MLLPTTRRALLFLMLIALILHLVDWFYWDLFPVKPLYSKLDLIRAQAAWAEKSWQREQQFQKTIRPFDPNEVDSVFLSDLNLAPSLQSSWRAYRAANGRFRSAEDLNRLFAMDSNTFSRLKPYVLIPEKQKSPGETNASLPIYQFHSFDPNTVSQEELLAMGLRPYQCRSIISFRSKFRPFRDSSDLFKVYGLNQDLVQSMLPYVKLENREKSLTKPRISLNQSDSLELIELPGLGPYRVEKLLRWRTRLGGFHSLEQLVELGILDSLDLVKVRNRIDIAPAHRRLNLNFGSREELQEHPYINYYLARNILDFREQIRPFKTVDELMNIELVDDVLFSKLAPYLFVSEKDTSALNLSN